MDGIFRISALMAVTVGMMVAAPAVHAQRIERTPEGKTIVNLKLWNLPDPSRTDVNTQAQVAVFREFVRRYPKIVAERYAERYRADAHRYGDFDWDNLEIRLQRFSGITIEGAGMDSATLMAIAGGVAPDILYVNFRQSDTYIQQRFLHPLDRPEDNYYASLTDEEKEFWIHPKVEPVIRRRGPDGNTQVWAMPFGGILGMVVVYRKDLLDAAGIPHPHNDWTWDDFYEACRKLTNPEAGTFGTMFGRGTTESHGWVSFLWSAGGEVMVYDEDKDEWRATFDSPAAVKALDFYTRLGTEAWRDADGRRRYGYAAKEVADRQRWDLGLIGFSRTYIDEKLFSTINPDVTGMVPVPIGPGGNRGAELNSRMMGIFAGIQSPVIRDAAWEFMRFMGSKDAAAIETRILVEGGLGQFVNPRYLRMFGYEDIIRLAPQGWEEIFHIAVETGKPEPYGRNCQFVYEMMSKPLQRAEQMSLSGELPPDGPERIAILERILREAVAETNEKMLGIIPPEVMLKRRISAAVMLVMIGLAFTLVFKRIFKAFTPPENTGEERRVKWGFRKYLVAYIILIPAVLSVFFWQYVPLLTGSAMAFQDYQIMGGSRWIYLDNFANLLWDTQWWTTVGNSFRYSILVISMTFLPPVILAVLLQEIPRGTILFRTVFYLPAVITGLVVIYLWRSFYEPTEFGVLNTVVMRLPAVAYIAIGLLFFYILFAFAHRLYIHQVYWVSALCLLVGILLFLFAFRFAHVILNDPDYADVFWLRRLFMTTAEPYRWLQDPKTAMFACVLPMVWAGMGPGCLIYLAALKGISDDFYEAADIDGATFVDKILFVVIPILKPLLVIQFVGVFIGSWNSSAFILAMTGGASGTEVAGLHIFYRAYLHLRFGQATAMAWVLGFMMIGFTVHQLRILSRLEFKTTGNN